MSLLNSVSVVFHDPKETKAVKHAFGRLGLPLPQKDEFVETSDNGFLVFLEPYGTAIRLIRDDAFPILKSDHILQPLGSLKVGEMRLDINPGVVTCINEDDVDELVDRLRREHIDYFDYDMTNTGWLPYATNDFPDGYPVVIDTGSVKKLHFGMMYEGKKIKYEGVQEKIFGDLQKSFTDAVSQSSADAMRKFWDQCAAKAETGILNASWTWKESRNIRIVSENYAERLRNTRALSP